jgi:FMN-dependent NADH-azoreductase
LPGDQLVKCARRDRLCQITQPKLTVAYSPSKGCTGLVAGKPLMLILARGGEYHTGNPLETFDSQGSYLRCIVGCLRMLYRANQFFIRGCMLGWQLYCHPNVAEN